MTLKSALQTLLGRVCYHIHELYMNHAHLDLWHSVLDGNTKDLRQILVGYHAAVDWPICAVWKEAANLFRNAPVLLSTRSNSQDWWDSVDQTVWDVMRRQNFQFSAARPEAKVFSELHRRLAERFCANWDDQTAAKMPMITIWQRSAMLILVLGYWNMKQGLVGPRLVKP